MHEILLLRDRKLYVLDITRGGYYREYYVRVCVLVATISFSTFFDEPYRGPIFSYAALQPRHSFDDRTTLARRFARDIAYLTTCFRSCCFEHKTSLATRLLIFYRFARYKGTGHTVMRTLVEYVIVVYRLINRKIRIIFKYFFIERQENVEAFENLYESRSLIDASY